MSINVCAKIEIYVFFRKNIKVNEKINMY